MLVLTCKLVLVMLVLYNVLPVLVLPIIVILVKLIDLKLQSVIVMFQVGMMIYQIKFHVNLVILNVTLV
jgi:hypothetical protein